MDVAAPQQGDFLTRERGERFAQGKGLQFGGDGLQFAGQSECLSTGYCAKGHPFAHCQLTHDAQVHQRQLSTHLTLTGDGRVHPLFRLGVPRTVLGLDRPGNDVEPLGRYIGQPAARLLVEALSGAEEGCTALIGDPINLNATVRLAQQQLLPGQGQVAATDVRMGARKHDVLLGLDQGEVVAVLIVGDQVNHLAGRAGGESQVESGVVGIVRAEVEATRRDDAGHGVEQADEVEDKVTAMAPGKPGRQQG
ncbi:hypothetical protein FQZ97_627190 [compost metagenome]